MASNVEFQDFSFQVKAALDSVSKGWLYETAEEIKSQAQRTTSMEGWTNDERVNLRDHYKAHVDADKGEAAIGNDLEMAYWEEWGTGEHAAHGDGRKDWWIYTPGESGGNGSESNHYATREEAEQMAAYIRATYDKEAIVTNGLEPNYTLEHAFDAVKPGAEQDLERRLREGMGE
ncbi:MAG: hypothetical protein ACI4WX_06175 [Aristaeellaceae bacterium]